MTWRLFGPLLPLAAGIGLYAGAVLALVLAEGCGP